MSKKFFLCVALLLAALPLAVSRSQEQASSVPPEQNAADGAPSSAATGDGSALFPANGAAAASSPASTAGRRNGQRRNGARGGGGRRSGYAVDAAIQQADTDPLEVRVAYRQAKTIAMARDPGMQDLLIQAANSRTDDEKRSYLKTYYTRLYGLILKIKPTPAMKAHVALLSQASEQRYDPKRRAAGGDDDLTGGNVGHGGGKHRR